MEGGGEGLVLSFFAGGEDIVVLVRRRELRVLHVKDKE